MYKWMKSAEYVFTSAISKYDNTTTFEAYQVPQLTKTENI